MDKAILIDSFILKAYLVILAHKFEVPIFMDDRVFVSLSVLGNYEIIFRDNHTVESYI